MASNNDNNSSSNQQSGGSGTSNMFGQLSGTPGNSSGGLFGSQPAQTTQTTSSSSGTSMFGTASSQPSPFGNATSQPSTQGGLFSQSNTSTSTTPASGGLFGSAAGGPTFSFAQASENKSQDTPTSSSTTAAGLFSGSNNNNNNTSSQPQTSNLFGNLGGNQTTSSSPGSATPTSSKPSLFSNFGSTTPAGPPPSNSLFGKPAQGTTSNLFGSTAPSTASGNQAQPSSPSLFGNPQQQTQQQQQPQTSQAQTSNSQSNTSPFGASSTGANSGTLLSQNRTSSPAQSATQDTGRSSPFTFPSSTSQQGQSGSTQTGQQSSQATTATTSGASTTTSTASAPTGTQNLFGSIGQNPSQNKDTQQSTSSNLFPSLGQPQNKETQPSSGGNLFAGVGQNQNKDNSSQQASGSNLFGSITQNQPKSTQQSTGSNLFSGFGQPQGDNQKQQSSSTQQQTQLFGAISQQNDNAQSSSEQKKDNTETPTSTPSPFPAFGQPQDSQKDSSTAPGGLFGSTTQPKETSTSQPQSLSSNTIQSATSAAPSEPAASAFGGISKPNEKSAASQPADSSAATSTGPAALSSSTAGAPPTSQSRLKNKSMDEIITRWASDLAKYQKEFQVQAEKVADWDRMLLENGNTLTKLYSKTYQAERDTAEVQKQLSIVESQQDELSQWLDRYEKEVEEMMARQVGQGEGLQGPDQERERTYKTAERVSERLSEMGQDLTSMIEEINDASAAISKTSNPDDPLSQIVRVLNGHLSQLQSIDQSTAALQAKVTAAQKQGQRMSSRVHGGYHDAADDFYRSYAGRS